VSKVRGGGPVPPEPDRFVAAIDAMLERQLFNQP